MSIFRFAVLVIAVGSVFACSTQKYDGNPVVLSFVAEEDLGLVVYPVDWFRPANRENPGVDCTLRLIQKGPPENIYSCRVSDAKNVFVVKVFEDYKGGFGARHISKITLDSRFSETRDQWMLALKNGGFWETGRSALGRVGQKWNYLSHDDGTIVTLFWNEKTRAVSAWVIPQRQPLSSEIRPKSSINK